MILRRRRAPKARRIALVADSHGLLVPALLDRLRAAAPDLLVHAGDLGAAAVLHALRAIAPVCAVAGNNDTARQWPAGEAALCAALPEVLSLSLAGGALVVVHGHQFPAVATRHARLRGRFPEARCIVYGHSHRRCIDTGSQPWVVNPGASGRARAFEGAAGLLLTVACEAWYIEVL